MVRKRLKHYFDYLDYKDMSDDPDNYFKNKKVINFNIIHNQCRGDPSQKSNKDHKIRFFLLFFVIIEMIYGLKGI